MNYPHIKLSRPAPFSSLCLLLKTAAGSAARNFSQRHKDALKRKIAAQSQISAHNSPRILLSEYMGEVNYKNLMTLGNRARK
jgi:hypothetical protein